MLRNLGRAFLMAVAVGTPACAEQSLNSLAGSWSGTGSMEPSDGPRERVRCKIDYLVGNEGQSVKMDMRCASEAYKMQLSANIDQKGSVLSGNWFESQYRQGGQFSGQHVNGVIDAKIESATITALLTVHTEGDRQKLSFESPGAWVSEVSINLSRQKK